MAADMLCMVLNELGCASDHAEDGAEALEILCMDSDLYSLVLMDLRMPVMDGFDATRAIRKMGIELPVIAVTADECFDTRARWPPMLHNLPWFEWLVVLVVLGAPHIGVSRAFSAFLEAKKDFLVSPLNLLVNLVSN